MLKSSLPWDQGGLLELLPQFEKASGCRRTEWAGMVDIRKRVEAGRGRRRAHRLAALIDELTQLGRICPAAASISRNRRRRGRALGAAQARHRSVEASTRAARGEIDRSIPRGPARLLSGLSTPGKSRGAQPKLTRRRGVFVGELIAARRARDRLSAGASCSRSRITWRPLPREIQAITCSQAAFRSRQEPESAKALLGFLACRRPLPSSRKTGFLA